MIATVRAGVFAALFIVLPVVACAASKPFQRDDLDDSAIKLTAQIKSDAGAVAKAAATLKREADAALEKRDHRAAMQAFSLVAAVAPKDATNWIRLARAILQVRNLTPANQENDRTLLIERATTAAYLGYQQTTVPSEEAEALEVLGRAYAERRIWRPALDAMRLSLERRETAELRATYEELREQQGFRILDYSVDSDAASPRACFQFSEELLGRRADFSPFVAVVGHDKPALTAEDKQLCVEGLKHGERYAVALRAGLPSTVHESLAKSAEFSIYVRDRKPFVHFTGRAYVLPRTGQHGIPLVSVNTETVKAKIFRIGDRSLIDTVLGSDFQRNVERYDLERLGDERGLKVWQGELKVESTLNADITTAFPVDQAVDSLEPGVYVMVAEPGGAQANDDEATLATQWFIVSDLGLTAFSGNDGIVGFVNSLASTDAKGGVELRLIARNNEVLATRRTDADGVARFEAGLARGEGGAAPAMLVAADPKGDYAFLSLKSPAFDLSDRGVAGRPAPAGLDAFVFTERGVYRTSETVQITALLRDGRGVAAAGALTVVVERPDGNEYRRAVVADQGAGGRSLSVPIVESASTGTWRVRAFTDPKRPAVGETTFLVEDYVPDRIEFDLASPNGRIAKATPAEVTLDGRYLYGAPASGLDIEGEVVIEAAKERPGLAGYQFGLADDEVEAERQALEDLGETDAAGKARFTVALDKVPASTRPLAAQVTVRLNEAGGRAVERKITLPVTPSAAMIGVKPLFTGRSLAEGDTAGFDVILAAPDGKPQSASGLRWELLRIDSRYQWYRQDGRWEYEPVKT
ncbi:MAG TPA: MG2 domain-containing protein, partial [Xanthobacteraceae bacterium]|nr:MG2 domain-containing protein [Xanthobacteraceae bacterium]